MTFLLSQLSCDFDLKPPLTTVNHSAVDYFIRQTVRCSYQFWLFLMTHPLIFSHNIAIVFFCLLSIHMSDRHKLPLNGFLWPFYLNSFGKNGWCFWFDVASFWVVFFLMRCVCMLLLLFSMCCLTCGNNVSNLELNVFNVWICVNAF